ncbi:Sas10 C-terminal domain-containing protein [Stachybotrys elegans]|uniref:Sas10 C-terminal domain-containing protein n=1 Tax=Stachybotrys elegans TaxID=80388 RepID=A0A8K0T5A9_9HYPO|nr:Sas10 C-terminal domain-containing protein [Stachybotrys elegans]
MAKKRKASRRNAAPAGPREVDPAEARIGRITTYEDVADSEDEFFINRDKIMLEDEPGSKRRRKDDEDLELSDEEILGFDDDDDESDEDEEEQDDVPQAKRKGTKGSRDDEEAEPEGEEEDEAWWGSSRKEYYDADKIETEADALEEEAEAKRLQQKKLSKMAEEDFVFDGDEWLAAEKTGDDQDETVVEVLKDVEISEDASPQERFELLQSRHPEFLHLVNEFQELQPLLTTLQKEVKADPENPLQSAKFRILGCYVAALASYFAILTSPARDSSDSHKTMDPAELREHDVMATLVNCRNAWQRASRMKSLNAVAKDSLPATNGDDEPMLEAFAVETEKKKTKKKSSKDDKLAAEKLAKKQAKAKAGEDAVADLYDLALPTKSKKVSKKARAEISQDDEDENSDFGEEHMLDARTAADKAARKKTLKFYTSQIAQKSNRRTDASRDAGGDMDIPYRERLRDRQARLMAAAEKRGKRDSKHGEALGGDSDEDDTTAANTMRGEEDEYYDMVAHKSKARKEDKAARYAAYAAASKADRVVENEEVGEDGKRKITYAIEKNKGLAPKRSKDVRNPRVKKRKQYEAKQKKLGSMRAVWKGGEPKGGYQGELSGINTGVVKSVKF